MIDKINAFARDVFTQNKEVIAIKQGVFGDRFHTAAPVSIKLPGQYNIIGYTLHTITTGASLVVYPVCSAMYHTVLPFTRAT